MLAAYASLLASGRKLVELQAIPQWRYVANVAKGLKQ